MSFLVSFLLRVLLILGCALVSLSFWNWFALPLGAPAITYWHMVGLRMAWGIFGGLSTGANPAHLDEVFGKVSKEWRYAYVHILHLIVLPIAWALGAGIHGVAF